MNRRGIESNLPKFLFLILIGGLFFGAGTEFYNVAFGTGAWFGGFSLKWGIAFLAFAVFCIAGWLVMGFLTLRASRLESLSRLLAGLRNRLGIGRWLAAALVLLAPIWLLQYSPWGVVFDKPNLRVLIWCLTVALLGLFITRDRAHAWTWHGMLAACALSAAGFVLIVPLRGVTSYPFALGWSEGNRLWDYSLLFGLHLYKYPPADPPSAYLELGRQLVGGIPFLLPKVSIPTERLWVALMDILPYLLLGWLAFRPAEKTGSIAWILLGLWSFTFLSQGPIHPALLICAILVAIARRQPLWLAIPLVAASGFYAQLSRYTWIFAPAIWAVMLEFAAEIAPNGRISLSTWRRSILIGCAGLFGSILVPRLMSLANWSLPLQSGAPGAMSGGITVSGITTAATKQPLLWYRLFPNATFGNGVVLGLLVAIAPLIILLVYLGFTKWKLNLLQKLSLLLPLLAFLVVGLVVSTKIGGGGDLHNMDMFLISLLFSAAIAWRVVGPKWFEEMPRSAPWLQAILLLAIIIPAFQPLMTLRPISFANDANWLVVLTDAARPKDLGSLAADDEISSDLQKLRTAVQAAQANGPVLFMDQRQLLTFGYIENVTLISEYEKKRMMDEALSSDLPYFQPFYNDLARHRFSLIISDPLRTPIKDSDYGFGEENNAWVKWVTKPVLCYYEEKDTLTDIRVQLLIPRQDAGDCSSLLP